MSETEFENFQNENQDEMLKIKQAVAVILKILKFKTEIRQIEGSQDFFNQGNPLIKKIPVQIL